MKIEKRTWAAVLAVGAIGLSVACGSGGSVSGPSSDSTVTADGAQGLNVRPTPSPSPSATPSPSPTPSPSANPSPSPSGQTDFRGTIESIAAPNLVVSGRLVRTDGSTRFRDSGNAVSFASLQVGQSVEVEGRTQGDGSVQATKVGIEDGPGNGGGVEDNVEFTGRVDSVTPPSLRVAGRLVITDSSTRIERRGDAIPLSSIHAGDRVEVEGAGQPDGSVRAKKVKLED